ncbi:MAG: AI-2E family transporter [Myxococcota bacterium]
MSEAEVWYRYTRYPFLLAKVVLYGLVVTAVVLVFRSVEAVLFPVLLSLLIAYLLDPTIDRLEERGWSRTTAIGAFLAVGAAGLSTFVLFLYPTIAHQIQSLVEGLPKLLNSVEDDLLPWLEANAGVQVPASIDEALAAYGETIRAQVPTVTKAVSAGVSSLWTQLGAVMASAVNLVMIPVFTFYFLRDFDLMTASMREYLPKGDREFYLDRIRKVDEVVGAWFRGQCEVAFILGILYAVGLALVFGFSGVGAGAGIAIGLIAGLLNIIPYFGFLIGFVLSILMVLLDWNGVLPVVGVVAVFGVVQGLEGWVITPRIVGEKVGLSPVVVILSLLLGQEILGLVGILLALPIAGGLRVLAPDFVAYWRASSWYTGKVTDDAQLSFVEVALAAERQARESVAVDP